MKDRAIVVGLRRVSRYFILVSKRFGAFDAVNILVRIFVFSATVRFDGQIDFVFGGLMSRSRRNRNVSIFVHLTRRIAGQTDSLFHLTRIDHAPLPLATGHRSFRMNG